MKKWIVGGVEKDIITWPILVDLACWNIAFISYCLLFIVLHLQKLFLCRRAALQYQRSPWPTYDLFKNVWWTRHRSVSYEPDDFSIVLSPIKKDPTCGQTKMSCSLISCLLDLSSRLDSHVSSWPIFNICFGCCLSSIVSTLHVDIINVWFMLDLMWTVAEVLDC